MPQPQQVLASRIDCSMFVVGRLREFRSQKTCQRPPCCFLPKWVSLDLTLQLEQKSTQQKRSPRLLTWTNRLRNRSRCDSVFLVPAQAPAGWFGRVDPGSPSDVDSAERWKAETSCGVFYLDPTQAIRPQAFDRKERPGNKHHMFDPMFGWFLLIRGHNKAGIHANEPVCRREVLVSTEQIRSCRVWHFVDFHQRKCFADLMCREQSHQYEQFEVLRQCFQSKNVLQPLTRVVAFLTQYQVARKGDTGKRYSGAGRLGHGQMRQDGILSRDRGSFQRIRETFARPFHPPHSLRAEFWWKPCFPDPPYWRRRGSQSHLHEVFWRSGIFLFSWVVGNQVISKQQF